MTTTSQRLFIQALKENVLPATGCTEPVAVAYAAATASAFIEKNTIKNVTVQVSPNIMKNALAVIVPGTGEPGLAIAAAAGIIVGKPANGLKVINQIAPTDLPAIKQLASSGKISVEVASVEDDLYVEVRIITEEDSAAVYIAGGHTNIFKIEKNGQLIQNDPKPDPHALSETKQALQDYNLKDIWDFSLETPLDKIAFMEEAGRLNMRLATEGLTKNYGLKLGQSLNQAKTIDFGSGMEADLSTKILAYSTAASDARMGGASLPAMSNSGSGNQGISATVPVCVVAEHFAKSDEERIRALTLSHLTAIYIHAFLPVLSAFCAADSAAMGSAAGISYLLTKDYDTAAAAINNMAGDAPGMVCDGAGCACAMKVATAVSSMYRAVNLALQGIQIPASNGLVCQDVNDTIKGIGRLATEGLKVTDQTILSIMVNK